MQHRNKIRIIYIAALIGILMLHILLIVPPVKAQSGSATITYNAGSGATSVDFGDNFTVTPGFESGFGGYDHFDLDFDDCYLVQWVSGDVTARVQDNMNIYFDGCNGSSNFDFAALYNDPSAISAINTHQGETFQTDHIHSFNGSSGGDFVFNLISTADNPPEPDSGLAAISDYCPLLGADASTFTNLPGKWTGNPTPHSADGEWKGLLATNGKYSLQLTLSKDRQYTLATKFRVTDPTRTETFGIQLGASPALIIQIANTSSQQSQSIAAANYTPDSISGDTSYYKLQIFSQLYTMGDFSQNGDLIIDYICVADTTPQIEGEDDPNKILNSEECKECVYAPVGDLFQDIPKIVDWAVCVLKRLFSCVLANWLYQLGLWLGKAGKFLASWQVWGGEVIQRFLVWAGDGISSGVSWLGGFLGNVLQFILNGAISVINWLGLGGLVNGILDFIRNIIPTVQQAADIAGLIFQIIKYWVERAVELILSIVFAIPLIFQGVIESFNETASTIPVWAPTCNDSNTFLFGPCLGFYVMDNTVFDGPIYYVLILLCGFVAFNTLLWSLGKIKGALAET